MRLRFLDFEPYEVFENAREGDARCTEFVSLCHRALAAATATSIHMEGPGTFFITGPDVKFIDIGLLERLLHEMVKMSPLQGSRFELVPTSNVIGIAREALGAEAFPFRATLFDKTPSANWLVVWHQDTALPLQGRHEFPGWGPWSVKDGVNYAHAPASALSQVLALRVHLDDSTAENGPLRVLPGTHTLGVLTDEALHDLSTKIAAVECLASQGGVLAMRPLIVHASSKSQSEISRRVLHIEYAESARIADGLALAIA